MLDMERFEPKKVKDVKVKQQYKIKVSNRFAASENSGGNLNNSVAQRVQTEDQTSAKRGQVRLQRLHDPSQINGHNLNNVRREARKHFRKKKRDYLKGKINVPLTDSKKKNIRVT
jgi:hypothetical protein